MNHLLVCALVTLGLALPAHAKKETKKAAAPVSTALKLDTAKSQIDWVGKKVLVDSKHMGNLKLKSGEVTFDKGQLTAGQFVIDMTTINSTDMEGKPKKADLEGHLKNADFFDVAKYPTATFKITSVKPLPNPAAGQPTHEVTGDLTLKDKTNAITFPAQVTSKEGVTEALANLKIDRTLWDVRYASDKFFKGLGDKVIANDIDLTLKLVATK
ncbi:MAG: YceI family protein [Bdellovibrionaceae bacterium]|nr:YceI family protein [Pseudobdellovibrionaceae bacterium]